MKYRLYIDEVGNPDLGSSENPNHRHLSLEMTAAFGRQIVEILTESKYHRSRSGRIEGYGRKWLP